ncbi:MAG TPA: TonB-dependent receptor plug domain-containing protein, partial [Patescibacteria group bacterium]|nr:TonB-dependent receptor plug domain-containing protein [Patescibacteria group bacterium]
MNRILPFIILFVKTIAVAQRPDTTFTTKEVIVEAARTVLSPNEIPAAISTVPQRDIQGIQAGISAEESLRRVPGVFVNNRYNFSQGERISIRGLGSRSQFGVKNIKILLDGIPLTFADGQAQLNNLDLSSAGSIEILHGANSTLYGNAAGGVILINSERERIEPLRLRPEFTSGYGGLLKGNVRVSGAINNIDYLASASATNFDGFREHSAAKFYNVNAMTGFKISDSSRISLIFNLYNAPFLMNPGGLLKAETEDDRRTVTRDLVKKNAAGKTTTQGQTGLRYTANFRNNQRVDASIYGILRTLDNPIVGRIINLNRTAGGFRSVYEKGFLKENSDFNFTIIGGLDAEIQSDERREFQNLGVTTEQANSLKNRELIRAAQKGALLTSQNENITSGGIFSQVSVSFLKDCIVNAG